MLNDKILEFYSELREDVQDYVKTNGPVSVNTAFKTLFLSYLTETGETLVSDCTLFCICWMRSLCSKKH